jgi:hypothetical protein
LLHIDADPIMPPLRPIQFLSEAGQPCVGAITPDGEAVGCVGPFASTYALAVSAIAADERRVLPPLRHPDPARCGVSGTGLTSYGSAAARDSLHKQLAAPELHFFGTATLSFADGFKPAPGDVFEVDLRSSGRHSSIHWRRFRPASIPAASAFCKNG